MPCVLMKGNTISAGKLPLAAEPAASGAPYPCSSASKLLRRSRMDSLLAGPDGHLRNVGKDG